MKTLWTHVRLLQCAPRPDFVPGEMLLEDGVISAIGSEGELSREDAEIIDMKNARIAPGLVDVHTHGRAGGDFVSADPQKLAAMARSYLSVGTTTVMPTLASAPLDQLISAAERLAHAAATTSGARLMGVHLEGRYLNPAKRGAHAPELLSRLAAAELETLYVRMREPYDRRGLLMPCRLSAALELDADGSFAATARRLGCDLSLGHTTANYAQATRSVACGVRGFTHLYNAMPPLHHRGGGAVMACFDAAARGEDVYGELICDGLHISPEMIRLAYTMLGYDHAVLITDSMEGAGCPDGDYAIAGQRVLLKDGRALTEDGALAGSTLGLWQAVLNLCSFTSAPLAQALICATRNPARLAGIDRLVGSLQVGCLADLLVIDGADDAPMLRDVYLGGIRCEGLAL